jgi:hypothetical protein
MSQISKAIKSDVANAKVVKRTERGWAAHYFCSESCRFRRNTLLQYGGLSIIVSTVGNKFFEGKREPIGVNHYVETAVFHATEEVAGKIKYLDADISREISVDSVHRLGRNVSLDDNKSNDMHEAVVEEISNKMLTGKIQRTT